jgi:pyruvate,water dikinase
MNFEQKNHHVRWFETLTSNDLPIVGGKNSSLGEMIGTLADRGIHVPGGFAITAAAYWQLLEENGLFEKIQRLLDGLQDGSDTLEHVGKSIRKLFLHAHIPAEVDAAIREAYRQISIRHGMDEVDVAVRSSATAEDLPDASFAGQQETFLNIRGEKHLIQACLQCYASLYTDRAIAYRVEKGFDHTQVALSIGVQKMVRSDMASSGVMFSIDTETGFPRAVVINAAWGLGEQVVQGHVTPDEYMVFKPLLNREELTPIIEKSLGEESTKMIYAAAGEKHRSVEVIDTTHEERAMFVLSDEEVLKLARWACTIEEHYGRPMDIEWAKDGYDGELYIVQARPETVQSRRAAGVMHSYSLKEEGTLLLTGISIGEAIAAGKVCRLKSAADIADFVDGSILVTGMTDPDWVPIMRRAAAIVTDRGGRTCHAAIVSRELGIPAIVGTGNATRLLKEEQEVTISCAEGNEGHVYEGILAYDEVEVSLENMPTTETRIMLNIASPQAAFHWWQLPCEGVGLARMEFIINNSIKIHPMALLRFDEVKDKKARNEIMHLTRGYKDRTEYFVEKLAQGISRIAAPHYPEPVIVRMSDFKTNEYADLIGGRQFEPIESNPMLGFRGASRYYSPQYRDGFALECRAIHRVREIIGLDNVLIMIPFCRTVEEADRVLEVLAENGLRRGENGLEVYVMAEVPSNVILADQFAERFDGFSIGSNDLTQLVLGVDRDSAELAHLFDERNEAVRRMIESLIQTAHQHGRKVGICGQAPSDHPEFAEFLVRAGIDSISLNPDSVVDVKRRVAELERTMPVRNGNGHANGNGHTNGNAQAKPAVVVQGGVIARRSNGVENGKAMAKK